jgi:hypothetical protein
LKKGKIYKPLPTVLVRKYQNFEAFVYSPRLVNLLNCIYASTKVANILETSKLNPGDERIILRWIFRKWNGGA